MNQPTNQKHKATWGLIVNGMKVNSSESFSLHVAEGVSIEAEFDHGVLTLNSGRCECEAVRKDGRIHVFFKP